VTSRKPFNIFSV